MATLSILINMLYVAGRPYRYTLGITVLPPRPFFSHGVGEHHRTSISSVVLVSIANRHGMGKPSEDMVRIEQVLGHDTLPREDIQQAMSSVTY